MHRCVRVQAPALISPAYNYVRITLYPCELVSGGSMRVRMYCLYPRHTHPPVRAARTFDSFASSLALPV